MKKTSLVVIISSYYLANNLLFNLSTAAETAPITPPTTVQSESSETTLSNTTDGKAQATTSAPANTADKVQSESKKIDPPEQLKQTIANYFAAWQKHDYKSMLPLENWEGGEKLDETKYIQSFDVKFKLHSWAVTKTEVTDNNEYKVLVLVSHNLPANIAALVGKDRTVNSTLVQWWRKQGDTFVHLYNLERERAMQLLPKMESLVKEPKNKPL